MLEEFSGSDGSSGFIVDGQMIYRTPATMRGWVSNYRRKRSLITRIIDWMYEYLPH